MGILHPSYIIIIHIYIYMILHIIYTVVIIITAVTVIIIVIIVVNYYHNIYILDQESLEVFGQRDDHGSSNLIQIIL